MANKTRKTRTLEGLPVVDATHDVDIHILPRDIKGASKKNPANCAAARASQREFGRDTRVFLSRTYVMDPEKSRWIRFVTPQSISREIVSFDRGSSFEPGEFTFKAPPESMKLGNYHSGTSNGPKSRGTRKKYHATASIRERGKYDPSKKMTKKAK